MDKNVSEKIHYKIYYDEATKRSYRFLWETCEAAYRQKAKREKIPLGELQERLSDRLSISREAVRNHFRNREKAGAGYPSCIAVVKDYGLVLARGDAYAFLAPLDGDAPPETAAYAAHAWEGPVQVIFGMLYDLLSLYAPSDGFNRVPGTEDRNGAWDHFEERVGKIRKQIVTLFPGRRESETAQKLDRILRETEIFLKSFSIPGVVPRWRAINPAINHFDCVYDLIDKLGREAAQSVHRSGSVSFAFFPDESEVDERNRYFQKKQRENAEGNLQYTKERIFQMELLETLTKVFEHDFPAPQED